MENTPNWISFFENSRNYSERMRMVNLPESRSGLTRLYPHGSTHQSSASARRLHISNGLQRSEIQQDTSTNIWSMPNDRYDLYSQDYSSNTRHTSFNNYCQGIAMQEMTPNLRHVNDNRRVDTPPVIDTISSCESRRVKQNINGSSRPLPALPIDPLNLQKRPLPPTPLTTNNCGDIQMKTSDEKKNVVRTVSTGDVQRKKKRKRRSHSTRSDKRNNKITETSVTLTVSVRNNKQAKKLEQEYTNNCFTTANGSDFNSRPLSVEEHFSRTESQKSQTELVTTNPKKWRRNACIIPMVILIVLILTGLLTAISVILIRPLEEENPTSIDGHDMVIGHVRMRLLNRKFHKNMLQNTSQQFTRIAVPLCTEMDSLFLFSNHTINYYGCDVTMLRSGSVKVLQELLFKDSKELRNPITIKHLIQSSSQVFDWGGLKAFSVGDFVVDYEGVSVTIETKKMPMLPRKPHFVHVVDMSMETTPKVIPNLLETVKADNLPKSTSTQTSFSSTTPRENFSRWSISRLQGTTPYVFVASTAKRERKDYETTSSEVISTRVTSTVTNLAGKPTGAAIKQQSTSTPSPVESTGPYISLTNFGGSASSVAIQCSLYGLSDWTYMTVTLHRPGKIPKVVLNVTDHGVVSFPHDEYKKRMIVNLQLTSRSTSVAMNFTTINCQDEGTYLCTAFSTLKLVTGKGYLSVRALPTIPILEIPVEIVEGRETKQPITCTANTGFPPGRVQWMIKPRDQVKFIPIDVHDNTISGECNNVITSKLQYTPTIDGNGTTLKCQVENIKVPMTTKYSAVRVMNVLSAGFCDKHHGGTLIPHPYDCDKFVTCSNNTLRVTQCQNELCFNPDTKTCGHTGISMTNVVAYLNEGVTSMKCKLLHIGVWRNITIRKIRPSGEKLKILIVNNNSNITYLKSNMKGRVFADVKKNKFNVYLQFWMYKLTCEDEGIYTCSADLLSSVLESQGRVILKVKPSSPKITIPTEIVDGRQPRENFTCEANVGYPYGQMEWLVKLKGENKFAKSAFNETVTEITENCSKVIKKQLTFVPTARHDSMELKCVVKNFASLSDGQSLWNSEEIHVIPANFCGPSFTGSKPHPLDCHQYVQCSEGYVYIQRCSIGLCFNSETLECDLPRPSPKVEFDPDFPCRPNKNGVYFPHPYLCNKYIWCVQGKEKTQHCPLGTLYLSNGQCTFNTDQSHCYKKRQETQDTI